MLQASLQASDRGDGRRYKSECELAEQADGVFPIYELSIVVDIGTSSDSEAAYRPEDGSGEGGTIWRSSDLVTV
jgi:hypothetical protein